MTMIPTVVEAVASCNLSPEIRITIPVTPTGIFNGIY